MSQGNHAGRIEAGRRQRDGGYLLLAIMLMMALMIIVATTAAPRVVQQIKRDREEEMIHRGTEYARAIKRFYKKNGRYPASLDELDKGEIRYLRRRYEDPLTKEGKWKLLKYADIQMLLNGVAGSTGALGREGGTVTPGGAIVPGVPSPTPGAFSLPQQRQNAQSPGPIASVFPTNSAQGYDPEAAPANTPGTDASQGDSQQLSTSSQQSVPANNPSGNVSNNQQSGTAVGQNGSGGNQTFGGGAIVGVASVNKDPTIRTYNKKKTYNEWQFIYNPMVDQANVLLRGPYQPMTVGGASMGTPAGQMQQSTSARPQGTYGQQVNSPQPSTGPTQP